MFSGWKNMVQTIEDVIVSRGQPYSTLTPHEVHAREAMFAVTVLAPLTGAVLAFSLVPRVRKAGLNFAALATGWLASVALFGSLIYVQEGRTTRLTFILAVAHNMLEVVLVSLLLKVPTRRAAMYALGYGLALCPAVFFLDMAHVFMGAAIMGGAIDFFIVLLLAAGGQKILAIGAAGHVMSAVAVFTDVVDNFGVLPYTLAIFLGVWTHVGCTLLALLYATDLHHDSHCHHSPHPSPRLSTLPELLSPQRHEHVVGRRDKLTPHISLLGRPSGAREPVPLLSTGRISPARSRSPSPSPSHHRNGSGNGHLLNGFAHQGGKCSNCYVNNPLAHYTVAPTVLRALVAASFVGSVLTTVAICYWIPRWGVVEQPEPWWARLF